jgi:hypothetical protein
MSSGMEKMPPIFSRPLWRDGFFWILIGTACLWAAFFWWLLA